MPKTFEEQFTSMRVAQPSPEGLYVFTPDFEDLLREYGYEEFRPGEWWFLGEVEEEVES
jgi:hypothetical protein